MTAKLLSQYKQQLQGLTLIPSGGGCFEVKAGDELIYSKLETGRFPDESVILQEVGARLKKKQG